MRWPEGPFPWWLGVVGGAFVVLVLVLVLGSLRRPSPEVYPPSSSGASPPDSAGVRTVTLDARSAERWIRFDLSAGRTVPAEAGSWDVAARRFHIVVNGGDELPGEGAAAAAGEPPLASVPRPPADGWRRTRADEDGELRHPLLESWYRYDFFSHLLEARPRVWAIRTSDGELYKLRFLSYYCPGPEAGCVTFRYAPFEDGRWRAGGTVAGSDDGAGIPGRGGRP